MTVLFQIGLQKLVSNYMQDLQQTPLNNICIILSSVMFVSFCFPCSSGVVGVLHSSSWVCLLRALLRMAQPDPARSPCRTGTRRVITLLAAAFNPATASNRMWLTRQAGQLHMGVGPSTLLNLKNGFSTSKTLMALT